MSDSGVPHPDTQMARGPFSEPQHRLLSAIAWNLAVIAGELRLLRQGRENAAGRGRSVEEAADAALRADKEAGRA